MRTATVINKKDLSELYGASIYALAHLEVPSSSLRDLTQLATEEIEIGVLNSIGPYTVARIVNLSDMAHIVIPSTLIIQKELPTAIDLFKPILDKLHPGKYAIFGNRLYILYPKLEITNSMRHKHTIYDLLVSMDFNEITGQLGTLRGTRLSWTDKEMTKNYAHSHLPPAMFGHFDQFCTGGGSVFQTMLYKLQSKVITAFEFEVFLLQLTEYLSWESLEGRPHISMSVLSQAGTTTTDGGYQMSHESSTFKMIVNQIISMLTPDDLITTKITSVLNLSTFYNIERAIVNTTSLVPQEFLMDYDESRDSYVSGSSSSRTIHTINYSTNCSKFMGYVPGNYGRKEEEGQQQESTTVKRLSPRTRASIIEAVNEVLLYGSQLTQDEQRDSVGTQTRSDSDREVITTDTVSTQSVS